MPASSGAPWFLLCLFAFLSVLASARHLQERDTPASGTLTLRVIITDHLLPSDPIVAERGNQVEFTVNNGGTDSVFVYMNLFCEVNSAYDFVEPPLMLTLAGRTDATLPPAEHDIDILPGLRTRKYLFTATPGSYRCEEHNGLKGVHVFIVLYGEPEQISGLDEAATRPNEDGFDNRQAESTIDADAIHHPAVLSGLVMLPGNDLVTTRNEVYNRLAESIVDIDAIYQPAVLSGLAMLPGNDLVTAKNQAPGIEDLFELTEIPDGGCNGFSCTTGQDFSQYINTHESYTCEHPSTLIDCRAINWATKEYPSTLINCREINWATEEHRRNCLARIVNTVYCGHNDVAALELSLLDTGFSLHEEPLRDGRDMYAAIYKYEGSVQDQEDMFAPDIIVAFRGTEWCFQWKTFKDNCLNCLIGIDAVKYNNRFKQAYEKVKELTSRESRVWLTGHSQGASLALHVGRHTMLEENIRLKTFAFNPPLAIFCWFPQIAKKFIGTMTPPNRKQTDILSKWTPELYVHKKDFLFCRCVIRSLKQPTQLDKWMTKMPSAILCSTSHEVNGGKIEKFVGPHRLDKWFKSNTELKLNCDTVNNTDEDNLNCQDVQSNKEDCEGDIEAQNNQNPEAPNNGRVKMIIIGTILAIAYKSRERRYDPLLPRRRHIAAHRWWDTLRRRVIWGEREHQM